MASQHDSILWEICEEHLDEATFLWEMWEAALVGASHTPDEVVRGPEERLRAHLDALVLGGAPVAERLLLPALADGDPYGVRVAAFCLLHAEDADRAESVLSAFRRAKPPVRTGIARAWVLAERSDIAERLKPLWTERDPWLRSLCLDALGSWDSTWVFERTTEALGANDACLVAAALRAVRRTPNPNLVAYVQRALEHPDAAVRYEAIATGVLLGAPGAWDACRREAHLPGPAGRLSLGLLALPGAPVSEELFESLVSNSELRRDVIWAMGFAGDVATCDCLVEMARDDEIAPLAAESLSAITGVDISGALWRAVPGPERDVEEIQSEDPPPEVRPEDDLPMPNAEALAAWWQTARESLAPRDSLLFGRPRSLDALRRGLAEMRMWRRPVLLLETASRGRTGVLVESQSWALRQAAHLAAWALAGSDPTALRERG